MPKLSIGSDLHIYLEWELASKHDRNWLPVPVPLSAQLNIKPSGVGKHFAFLIGYKEYHCGLLEKNVITSEKDLQTV